MTYAMSSAQIRGFNSERLQQCDETRFRVISSEARNLGLKRRDLLDFLLRSKWHGTGFCIIVLAWSIAHRRSGSIPPAQNFYKIFCLSWNVIDNKGPKLRKMGQMRLPWNVYENRQLSPNNLECS